MKLLDILKLSDQEQKLIKRVFTVSLSICVLTVIIAWYIQRTSIIAISDDKAQPKSDETDITALYSAKSDDLLPIDLEAHKIAAEKYIDVKPQKSINHLLRMLAVDRKNREVKLALATAYLKSGMYAKAEQLLKALLDKGIADTLMDPIMSRYGLTLFFIGRTDESRAYLEKTVDQFDSSAEAYCYLGQVAAAQNLNSQEAEEFLKKSLAINPYYGESWYQLARFYMNKPGTGSSLYREARKCLIKHIEIEPLNPKAHSRLGMVYFYLQEPYLAEKSYQTALALNETDYNTHYNLGELYYSLFNDSVKALKEFEKTLAINPLHIEANFKKGLILLENNNLNEAIQSFTTALQNDPANIRILLQLGVAYEKKGMQAEAINVYRSILQHDALNDVALQKLKLLGSRK